MFIINLIIFTLNYFTLLFYAWLSLGSLLICFLLYNTVEIHSTMKDVKSIFILYYKF